MNKKVTIVIILILALALVAGGFWCWQNNKKAEVNQPVEQIENQEQPQNAETEVDTSDWKTYHDEKYGFEIRYPKRWEIRDGEINAFGGEWLFIIVEGNNSIVMQINRRILENGNPLKWVKEKIINNSIGGGQKVEVMEYLLNNPYIYAFHVRLDNSEMYVRHLHLVSNKRSMIYFNFEEISRRMNQVTGKPMEMNFSKYLPEFEAMVHSIKFFD